MARPRNQPRQSGRKRKGATQSQGVGLTVASLPASLAAQPSITVWCPCNVSTANGTTNIITTNLSATISGAARFAALAATFMNVQLREVAVHPVNLAAAQYVVWALAVPHLPYLASAGDVVPVSAASSAPVETLPGARTYQQGNGVVPVASLKVKVPQLQCARFITDNPWMLNLYTYSTANSQWAIFYKVTFTGYMPSF